MANRNFPQSRIYSGHYMPVLVTSRIVFGATGSVSSFSNQASLISSVTKLATGLYQVQLADNYAAFISARFIWESAVSGSSIQIQSSGSPLTVGQPYQIVTVGNNTLAAWQAVGLPVGIAPAVGASFVATSVGSGASGTGRVQLVLTGSGIDKLEIVGDPSNSSAIVPPVSGSGAIINIQTLQAQIGSATSQGSALQYALASPTSTAVLKLEILMSNSSLG